MQVWLQTNISTLLKSFKKNFYGFHFSDLYRNFQRKCHLIAFSFQRLLSKSFILLIELYLFVIIAPFSFSFSFLTIFKYRVGRQLIYFPNYHVLRCQFVVSSWLYHLRFILYYHICFEIYFICLLLN